MYSPKELEGEVDHSFFDSDCDASALASEDVQPNKQKVMERQDEKTGGVSIDQIGRGAQSVRNSKDGARFEDDLKQGSRGQNEETELKKERQSSEGFFKGSLSLPSAKSSETVNNSQSDEGSSVHSYSSDEERELDFKLRKTNVNVTSDDDDDGYHRSDDESEEDRRSPVTRSTKHKGLSHGTPKKSAGKFHKLSRSRSSSSDPESSQSSEERSSFQSQKSSVKHRRVGSAYQKERPRETAESEDTVTDVTPLSTPNVSPSQSSDVALPSEPVAADVQQRQQPSVTEKMLANDISVGQDSLSSEGEGGPVFLKVEKQLNRVLMVSSPGSVSSSRKNYSFTNEEVRQIDRENQRLLHELSRSSARSRSGSSACSKSSSSSRRSSAPPIRLYHSALNRQREQERIQKENMAFLKRLESVKPTPGMTRDEQLADYQQQCRYLGTHNTAIPPVKLKSSKTSGRASRPGSSPHKSRSESAKLRTTPRPAWS
ncbi:cilia- and flagella-associated protein 97 [Puntigrus tetrazona]|uniref:cilia- and flagella-associated protein 97 n=1 Tax=Puntigrus tetrazona TaxID=1606681 RepID=UPI001C8930DB|nr:cilia- and flagella-associated protein 97 [Puntigrus tetrazona]XP_043099006.1 cilia- and flagella-associated protein 97 [Puntigrus tetrazona]XP_043099017.1 cilia- and flagella-associated protein 97 [Puntigrus tetrazona]